MNNIDFVKAIGMRASNGIGGGLAKAQYALNAVSMACMDKAAEMQRQSKDAASGDAEPDAYMLLYYDEDGIPMREVFFHERHAILHYEHNTKRRGLSCEVIPLYEHPPLKLSGDKQ